MNKSGARVNSKKSTASGRKEEEDAEDLQIEEEGFLCHYVSS